MKPADVVVRQVALDTFLNIQARRLARKLDTSVRHIAQARAGCRVADRLDVTVRGTYGGVSSSEAVKDPSVPYRNPLAW